MSERDVAWTVVTTGVSLLVATGYLAIAVKWYLQSRVATGGASAAAAKAASAAALVRLRVIFVASLACGYAAFAAEARGGAPAYVVWRGFDVAMLVLAAYAWSFFFAMPGLRLVTDRLAAADEFEHLARLQQHQAQERMFHLKSISHDLRAPLNTVALNAQLLRMTAADRELSEGAAAIADNVSVAGNLLAELLDCARIGVDVEAHVDPKAIDLRALLAQTARRLRPLAAKKGLTVDALPGPPAPVFTDHLAIERIVGNLVDNAIKFTAHGGITLSVDRSEAPGTDAEGRDAPARYVVRVRDTGIGVPAYHAPRLFDEFYQAGNEQGAPQGFGLGLAICRRLARRLGGDVRLAHTGPDGSTFELDVVDAQHGNLPPLPIKPSAA